MRARWWPVATILLTAASTTHPAYRTAIAVDLIGPSGSEELDSITPSATIRATGVATEDRPVTLGLEIATSADFTTGILVDTSVAAETALVAVTRPLPSGATVYVRGRATSALGETVYSATSTRDVPTWIRLVSPGPGSGVVTTRRPRFDWVGAPVRSPPGPWRYTLQLIRVATGQIVYTAPQTAAKYLVPAIDLDLNASYGWAIVGRLGATDSIRVESFPSTFIIANSARPATTILYSNFPNPFPTPTSRETCIWFDLAEDGAEVRLDILDLQGRVVRILVPPLTFAAGPHGRETSPVPGTCAGDIRWDGTGEDGRTVPAGAYFARLKAGRIVNTTVIVFKGR